MRVKFALAAVAAAAAAPATGQASSVGGAIASTTCGAVVRNGGVCTGNQWTQTMTAMQAEATASANRSSAISAGNRNWWQVIRDLFSNASIGPIQEGFPITWGPKRNDGDFGGYGDGTGGDGAWNGGGASGSWSDPTPCKYTWDIDESGALVVPTIPLTGGGPMRPLKTGVVATPLWSINQSPWPHVLAERPDSVMLYFAHLQNNGLPKERWWGAWAAKFRNDAGTNGASLTFSTSSLTHWNGTDWVRRASTTGTVMNYGTSYGVFPGCVDGVFSQNNSCRPCPETSTGGDFDFYLSPSKSCVMYSPNFALSSSGYNYPEKVAVPFGTFIATANQPDSLLACELDPSLIERMAEELWRRASFQPTYTGYPPKPVNPEDVKVNGDPPRAKELQEVPPAVPTADNPPGQPPVPAQPLPTPTPTPTPSTSYDPTVNNPDLVAPEIDWWPDLPTIEVDLGNPACPTYPINVPAPFNWSLTVDQHCPLVEQNRAAIAAIFLLMWSVGAVLVVLRA